MSSPYHSMLKRMPYLALIVMLPLLTQCEDREQRMLFEAAQRTEKDIPSAHSTEEAYNLTIRIRPDTKLAMEAQDRIELIKKRREKH